MTPDQIPDDMHPIRDTPDGMVLVQMSDLRRLVTHTLHTTVSFRTYLAAQRCHDLIRINEQTKADASS